MGKITNKKILYVVSLFILILVPIIKFFSMYLEKFKIINNYDCINPAIILYVSVPFLIYVYIKDIKDKKRKLNIFDYLFYILVFAGIISVLFSINKNISIFGKELRHEGFLSVLSYYLLFINWKVNGTKKDAIKFIKLLTIIGIVNALFSLFQIYVPYNPNEIFDPILRYEIDVSMASGLCGNPNFFGSLIVTVISMVICDFLIKKDTDKLDTLKIILLFVALINSQSSGPFLAFIVIIIFLIIFLFVRHNLIFKRLLILIIILLPTYLCVIFVNKYIMKFQHCEFCIDGIKSSVDTGGTGRIKIWENSFEIAKNNFIVGVGFDNLYLVYPTHDGKFEKEVIYNTVGDKVEKEVISYYTKDVDNAHNVYLHMSVSNGMIMLIPYLTLLIFTFIKGVNSNNKLTFVLLSGFITYSVQAFFNISVIQVAPIYYIIIGIILAIT